MYGKPNSECSQDVTARGGEVILIQDYDSTLIKKNKIMMCMD